MQGDICTDRTNKSPRVWLQEARLDHGWSQLDLAEQIETTRVNISRWERGVTRPGPYFRRKLCVLFGRSEEQLDLCKRSDKRDESDTRGRRLSFSTPFLPQLCPALPLIGRQTCLERSISFLTQGLPVVITGLPGVGKTALAILLVHHPRLRTQFDGVLWASLGRRPDLGRILKDWCSQLGLTTQEETRPNNVLSWVEMLRSALSDRSIMVVIDDAWQAEHVRLLMLGGPDSVSVVTTRLPCMSTQLAQRGEWVTTCLHPLGREESLTLLRELCQDVVDQQEAQVVDLLSTIGGLPAVLIAAGNYLRTHARGGHSRCMHQAVQELGTGSALLWLSDPFLKAEFHTWPAGWDHISLATMLTSLVELLDEPEREALVALAKARTPLSRCCSATTWRTLLDTGWLSEAGDVCLHPLVQMFVHTIVLPSVKQSEVLLCST
jgi:transcriptional regulator with XRE-family HTH domain